MSEPIRVLIETGDCDGRSLLEEADALEAAALALRQCANAPASSLQSLPPLSKALLSPTPDLNAAHAMDYQSALDLGDRLAERLSGLFDGFAGAVALRDLAVGAGADTQAANAALARVRKPIEYHGRAEIRAVYRLLWNQGRSAGLGHHAKRIVLREDEQTQQTRLYRDEQQLFVNALRDVEENLAKMPLARRSQLYGQAAMEAYWLGFVLSDLSADRWIKWRLGLTERSCGDCPRIAKGGRYNNGIYRARELAERGLVPRCRHLACYGGCGCGLEVVARPAGAGGGVPLSQMVFAGDKLHPAHAAFGGERTGREKLAQRAKKLKWNWTGRK